MTSAAEDWRKSSYSACNGNCVEVWDKSSYSMGNGDCLEWQFRKSSHSHANGSCTEAALRHGTVQVRDSKLGAASPVLSFSPADWAAFTGSVKAGV